MGSKIKKVAELTGLSESTVKRALGNCNGIKGKTKEKVLAAAEEVGAMSMKKRVISEDIALVVPNIPTNFWGVISKEVIEYAKSKKCKVRTFYYVNTNDDNDALKCLSLAVNSGIKRLILCLPDSSEIRSVLAETPKDIRCVLLEEYIDVCYLKNVYFVGENSYKEGYDLALRYNKLFPNKEKFIIYKSDDSGNSFERISGFTNALVALGKIAVQLFLPVGDTNVKAAIIARELEQYNGIDCIYSPGGDICDVSLALSKLKKEIHVVGFESRGKDYPANVKLLFDQDLIKQSRKAVDIALSDDVAEKKTYMPNILIIERE